jgi:hypothetical protein
MGSSGGSSDEEAVSTTLALETLGQPHPGGFDARAIARLVKGFGEKALEARAGGNHAQLSLIQSLRARRQRSGRTTCCAWSRDEIK